jgi:hypothetical protein
MDRRDEVKEGLDFWQQCYLGANLHTSFLIRKTKGDSEIHMVTTATRYRAQGPRCRLLTGFTEWVTSSVTVAKGWGAEPPTGTSGEVDGQEDRIWSQKGFLPPSLPPPSLLLLHSLLPSFPFLRSLLPSLPSSLALDLLRSTDLFLTPPLWNRNVYPRPIPRLHLRSGKELFCVRISHIWSHLNETLDLTLDLIKNCGPVGGVNVFTVPQRHELWGSWEQSSMDWTAPLPNLYIDVLIPKGLYLQTGPLKR